MIFCRLNTPCVSTFTSMRGPRHLHNVALQISLVHKMLLCSAVSAEEVHGLIKLRIMRSGKAFERAMEEALHIQAVKISASGMDQVSVSG